MKALLSLLLFLSVSILSLFAQIAEIPFEIKKDIIFLEVAINDNEKANTFIFDTGAAIDLLDENVAKRMGLEPNFQQEVPGAGGSKVHDIILSQKLRLQETVEVAGTHLLLTDLTRLRDKIEKDFDGIIGHSFLRGFVTRIDYENKRMYRYKSIEDIDTTGYTPVTFEFHGGIPIPQFDISITLTNGNSYTGRIFFDSGAAYSLIVNTPFNEANKLTEQADRRLVMETENLSTKSVSQEIAIRSMQLGGFELGEMPIAVATDKEGVSSFEGYLGLMGARVISRFHVILDYTASTLYLKPNSRFAKPFEFPLSGIELKTKSGSIVVQQVQESSPAYQQGIRKGDLVLSVGGDDSGDIEQYRKLLKEEGKTCELEVKSPDGSVKQVSIVLERLL